jgi:Carboxypeptidase regulatory-like domain/TonB dependent receptor
MRHVHRMLTATVLAGLTAPALVAWPAAAQTIRIPEAQSVRVLKGVVSGSVSDEAGGPLAGATVSAVGQTLATAVSDSTGHFSISALPPGEYVIQAHLSGFAGSRREIVRVSTGSTLLQPLQLRRLERAVATTGTTTATPVYARPILAAGFSLPGAGQKTEEGKETEAADHPHSELAWRLRHIKRSILKDASSVVTLVDDDEQPSRDNGWLVTRAFDTAASYAATFFTDLPFSGEVNVLTTGALTPDGLFSGEIFPRGIAFLSIGAPTPAGDWSLKASLSQGDLSSWLVAGAFESRGEGTHDYAFGLTYSTQDYLGGNPAALANVKDGSRNVGEVYAYDRWLVTPHIEIEYGGRYARHDYLPDRGLLSPLLGFSVEPFADTWITTTVSQRMVAPGAEEFLASDLPGPWLPPERTFSPLGGLEADFKVERARSIDVTLEREFDDAYVVGVRKFYQNVDDQLVTVFGLALPNGPQSVGHYYVGTAGSVDADGWAFRIRTTDNKRVRGSIDYSVANARWLQRGDDNLLPFAPAALRPARERVHDVTTTVETDIPETSTRVFVLYKINNAYTRSNTSLSEPGLDARFDVQVNQALPFGIGGTQWEVLVGVRNLFRDPNHAGSVYDELLVVKPPKRVVGGFLVRF